VYKLLVKHQPLVDFYELFSHQRCCSDSFSLKLEIEIHFFLVSRLFL
jgi:hypothetical protein